MASVDVSIPVDARTAAALASDPERRVAAGRLMSLLVHPMPGADPLVALMREMGADAAARGLTPALPEAELATHKRERQG